MLAWTRAEERLYLTRAIKRQQYGTYKNLGPSPFLEKIENELLTLSKSERIFRKKDDDNQLSFSF